MRPGPHRRSPAIPSDTSAEGAASPLHGRQPEAGDPLLAFDNDGNLFAGGIAFNRVNPQNGDVWVASYASTPHAERLPEGLPAHRGRRPGHAGAERDLPGQAGARGRPHRRPARRQRLHLLVPVRRLQRPHEHLLSAAPPTRVRPSRNPVKLSDGKDVQGCDIAIEHDGDVYVSWGTRETPSSNTVQGLAFARSADGGATFARAGQVAELHPVLPVRRRP